MRRKDIANHMRFVYCLAIIIRKIVPYKIYCKAVGDSYSADIAKMKKDIWHSKELYQLYKSEIDYMKKHGRLYVFPYAFHEKYKGLATKVYRDSDGMGYVLHCGKKLFFPQEWTDSKIRSYYNGILAEQDTNSPHCYFTGTFQLKRGGVFVDVGCAEAMASLECVDVASKLYLFEYDEMWFDALKKTFCGYEDKVNIVRKFVSDESEGEFVRLDDILNEEILDNRECLLKMDIEGNETIALKGAEELLRCDKLKIACCLYHNKEDEIKLPSILKRAGFDIEISEGYMLQYFHKGLEYPYFRKVLVRAVK